MTTPIKERTFESDENLKLPRPFVLRRLHSLLGLWLVVFLFEHLLVNSQAALFFQDNGSIFVSMVNRIQDIPYLKAVEVLFLGLPFLIHGWWGILYALKGKNNSRRTDGTKPALPQYKRNHAYTWQRITSWLLVFGILAHVVHMRFIHYPIHFQGSDRGYYMVRLSDDKGLPLVAEKLNAHLYDSAKIREIEAGSAANHARLLEMEKKQPGAHDVSYYYLVNLVEEEKKWLDGAEKLPLKNGEMLASAPSAGAAILLVVRDAFKSPLMVILYSLLVIAATYHAFNGLWTFLITWGITLTRRSQKRWRTGTSILMCIVLFFGLYAGWGTYFSIITHS